MTLSTLMTFLETHSDGDSRRQPRDHPLITSAYEMGRWFQKMVFFAEVWYCIYVDIESGWAGPKMCIHNV